MPHADLLVKSLMLPLAWLGLAGVCLLGIRVSQYFVPESSTTLDCLLEYIYMIQVSAPPSHSVSDIRLRSSHPALLSTLHITLAHLSVSTSPSHTLASTVNMPSQDIKAAIDAKPVVFTLKTSGGKWKCTLHGNRQTL